MYTGDELSKRAKFAFISWIGSSVGALKRAKVSIDKTLVKEVVTVIFFFINPKKSFFSFNIWLFLKNFAVELAASDINDLDETNIKALLIKAGGANYGTGSSRIEN